MHIAVIAPPWYSIPPRAYGGIEVLLAGLVEGVRRAGHEVSLVCAGDSPLDVRVRSTLAAPASEHLGEELPAVAHAVLAEAAVRDLRPDVVHDHTTIGPLLAADRPSPTLTTVHGPVAGWYRPVIESARLANPVAISRAHARSAPTIRWFATVPNGIDVSMFPCERERDDTLLFLGRMHPDKGVAQAIEVAERSGRHLVIAARMHGRAEEAYFHQAVRPRLGSTIEYVGELDHRAKVGLLSRCAALLFPLQWDEPYGLVVAEAQACGAPVLALRRGAIPELVVEGRTALLADHHLDLVPLLERLGDLLPAPEIRRHARRHLDVSATVLGYLRAYERLLGTVRRPDTVVVDVRRRPTITVEAEAPSRTAAP